MTGIMIISCSSSKNSSNGEMQAIERYEGTTYKIIKKARNEGYWPQDTHIFIVSAKYGLISEQSLIEPYDQKMTKERAIELRSKVSAALDLVLRQTDYKEIFVNMGKIYMLSTQSSSEMERARRTGILKEAYGGIGMRLGQTKAWIVGQHQLTL
jgi:hypothetical protein